MVLKQIKRRHGPAGRRGSAERSAIAEHDAEVAGRSLQADVPSRQRRSAVYALVVGDKGPALQELRRLTRFPVFCFRDLALPARNASIADLASVMQTAVLDRPVLIGQACPPLDFTRTWTPDETQFAAMRVRIPPPSGDASSAPGLFTAIQEQLGLKFESTRASVDVMVVDHVERPTEN